MYINPSGLKKPTLQKSNYFKLFWKKYAIWTFLAGVFIGALVAYNQLNH